MFVQTFTDWLTNPEFVSKGHIAVFNDGEKDYLVCREDFASLMEGAGSPEMIEIVTRIAKSTIVSPVASEDEIDRLSNSETK